MRQKQSGTPTHRSKKTQLTRDKVYFAGLLANVDSSILGVKLDHHFEIEATPNEKGTALFSALEDLPYFETGKRLFIDYHCLNPAEKRYFVITNSFEPEYGAGQPDKLFSKVADFDNRLVHGYLDPALRLMRLFKEGNIFMPLKYFFRLKDDTPKAFLKGGIHRYVSPELYSLEPSEIPDLENFIRNTRLPFTQNFAQLAFESFELSYHTQDMNLSFLSLVTSLEALLNPGEQEVTYTIARNTAVLLGRNKDESENIYRKVREQYRKALVNSCDEVLKAAFRLKIENKL